MIFEQKYIGCNAIFVAIGSALAVGLAGAAVPSAAGVKPVVTQTALKLHVPSPDWRDQVIYFAMTDRFDDGDPSNNNQGAGEYNPASNASYSGGDLKGLARRIDYIQGLGATALWITPPVANQWWDASIQYGGYHGYWAQNFRQLDRHVGNLADYKNLSHRLHSAGMYLVQDIVLNHTGNFFEYNGPWDRNKPSQNFRFTQGAGVGTAPNQWPFSMNDARKPAHRKAGIYHWTPNVADFGDPVQERDFQMSGLDDLNTENPVVRRALRESYAYWIKEVGVDAFRLDTAFYVPPGMVADFVHAHDPKAPGIARAAAATGRKDFFVFGEGFGIDKPYEDKQARKIETYVAGGEGLSGTSGMKGMLNFPLYGSAGDVLARGRPTAELGYRIQSLVQVHTNPHHMPSFVDNHDVDRFLAGGDALALQHNLALIMTLPGVPVIYYGTEQGFTEQRAAMFKGGYGSGGVDHFNTQAPLYQTIRRLTQLRREHRVFSRGTPTILRDDATGPGVLVYRMRDGGRDAFVAFNTAPTEALADNLETGLPPASVLQGAFDLQGVPANRVVDAQGRVSLRLAPRSVSVWIASGEQGALPMAHPVPALKAVQDQGGAQQWVLRGRAQPGQRAAVVVDGNLQAASIVTADADGTVQATINTGDMVDPALVHRAVLWLPDAGQASAAQSFRVARPWTLVADVEDPAGDDTGPTGRYQYPTDSSWGAHRQLDLRRLRASTSGAALRLDLTMHEVTTLWNPANGFDHVAFTVFIEMPQRSDGARAMPLQNADLPAGMRWHYRLRAHGWSNALFSAEGASAGHEGTLVGPAADIRVDRATQTVSFTFKASSLGNPASLSGAKIYVTTWDYDGGFRVLRPAPSTGTFAGGQPGDALIMDASAIMQIP